MAATALGGIALLFAGFSESVRDALFPEPALPGYARAVVSEEFPVTMGRIALATALQRSVYEDDDATIRSKWSALFDSAEAVLIGHTENRYALFTSRKTRRQYVVIRGTANLSNLMDDLRFLKKRDQALGVAAHEGFLSLAKALRADLEPRLKKKYRIHVVGHSLGAAEAQLLGLMLKRDGYRVVRVIALAPPKATDADGWAAADAARLPVLRVVTPYDPVPFLPPRAVTLRDAPYTHGANLLMLLDGDAVSSVPAGMYDDLAGALRGALAAGQRFDVPDHMIDNYQERIESKKAGLRFVPASEWMRHATRREGGKSTFEIIREMMRPPAAEKPAAPEKAEAGPAETPAP